MNYKNNRKRRKNIKFVKKEFVKKVLIITYYWPPSGGIGVHRCLKFAKYLRDFGWEPIIYTASNAQYAVIDHSNEKEIPPNIEVLKQPIWEPYNIFKKVSGRKSTDSANPTYVRDKKQSLVDKLSIWIRGNLFIPDARCFWIQPSVKYLSNYLQHNSVDAILTDGPPHTNTRIGYLLSKKFDLPWLADFQDPWTQVDYYEMLKIGAIADRKHRKMEKQVFEQAKKITIASPTWGKDLESIGAQNVSPIFWGYDETDFDYQLTDDNSYFSIVHAGLLGYDRSPGVFLSVLSDLKKEVPGFAEKLRLDFAGQVDYSIKELIRKYGLDRNFNEHGQVLRRVAIDLTRKASILLLPLNKADNAKGRIPGKLFECIRSRRPILCLGVSESDVSKIIDETKSGASFEYEDYQNIRQFVSQKYQLFEKKDDILPESDFKMYDVKNQVKKVAGFLDDITV